ncbi:MAG TPA: phytoene/squalene synthase family protein [Luteimonas sp.]|nr:phytoene/squalene synthase family protein [Luteimonas sp.]
MDTADEFIAKWRTRWPEWGIGGAFLPPSQRDPAQAWFALLQELTDAAWAGADATPGLAKLAWWNEELQGWGKGARRHPLGARLQPLAAPWIELAAALRALQSVRDAAPGEEGDGLGPFAGAAARCEAALFDGEPDAAEVLRDLQAERLLLHGDAEGAISLLSSWPGRGKGPRARRLQSAFLRQRLRALAAGSPARPPSPLRSLWLGWRAARG